MDAPLHFNFVSLFVSISPRSTQHTDCVFRHRHILYTIMCLYEHRNVHSAEWCSIYRVSYSWVGGVLCVFCWAALNIVSSIAITGSQAVCGSLQCACTRCKPSTLLPLYPSHVGLGSCHLEFTPLWQCIFKCIVEFTKIQHIQEKVEIPVSWWTL